MNCKCILTVIVAGLAAVLSAGPVNVELKKGAMYRPDTKLFWRNMTFSNGLGRYQMSLSVAKPVGNKPQFTALGFNGGGFGFCDRARAFDLVVNGISLRDLNFTADHFSLWNDGENKGVEIKMNFDGAKVVTRFYMRPDSGVLWCRLYTAADTLEPVQSVKFSATCLSKASRLWRGSHVTRGPHSCGEMPWMCLFQLYPSLRSIPLVSRQLGSLVSRPQFGRLWGVIYTVPRIHP